MTNKEITIMPMTKEEKEALLLFNQLWLSACDGSSAEELREIAPNYEQARIKQIIIAATMPIGAIIKMVGSQAEFSLHYCISRATVQSWCAQGKSKCPPHLRLIFCRDLKLI